ncbi:glycine betaine ABC transporter substrate-binding protein [Metabacillus malikii]|uniref:Glycine betaine/proline transport system substrate-binding protein n=1 Tax=Metabacillus malikii TaxID=1504265 RepID=A0ABT9ZCE7_9BACI|nr:glycine betaine ABC transporter substrate-binding protein [Metabacillus malikii]MDQ0229946.1 glycine betaine/proline transport system substrate-binding protein [Metabacillus malikii]
MFTKMTKVSIALGLSLTLAACNSAEESSSSKDTKTIGEAVNYEVIGIDPGAGIMKATSSALEEYELSDWELVEGSGAAMTASLKKAYDKEEPIIITGWTPHWKFSKFDLKYLEDPKGVYGEAENIHSIARKGLAEDLPGVHKVIDQFAWTPDEMGEVMSNIQDGVSPEEASATWVEENSDKVAEWTKDAKEGNGEEVKLAYVAWDSEIASTNVLAKVLLDLGYDVKLSQVEAGPMWAGVANGSIDAHVAGWLPLTHADPYEKFEGQFDDLGANLEGAKTGLVVPSYMDIDSIEDLK